MKTILVNPIGRGYEAEVDDEDYQYLSQHKWSASESNRTVYAKTTVLTDAGWKVFLCTEW